MASIYSVSAPNGWSVDSITGKFINAPVGSPDSAGSGSATNTQPTTTNSSSSSGSSSYSSSTPVTISKMGSTMQVMPSDLSYYLGQGWAQSGGTTTTPATQAQSGLGQNSIFIQTGGRLLGFKDEASANAYIKDNKITDQSSVGGSYDAILHNYGTPVDMTGYTPKTDTNVPTTTNNTSTNIPAADQKWVNDAYQKYFDRTATSSELANWAKESPQALEQFLQSEQKKYGYTSTAQKTTQDQNLQDALKMVDDSNLPPDIKALWKTTVQNYPKATDFNIPSIINTFNQIKAQTIDPYYKQLSDVAINDLKTNFNTLQTQRTAEQEAERANAGLAIRQAKAGNEAAGMTFTGKSIQDLGAGSAYAQPGDMNTPSTQIPTQIPFGGMDQAFYEGNVNQGNRLIASSSAAKYASNQQAIADQAAKQVGDAAVQSAVPGLSYSPGGTTDTTATLTQDKQGKEATTLQGLVNNWVSSQKTA